MNKHPTYLIKGLFRRLAFRYVFGNFYNPVIVQIGANTGDDILHEYFFKHDSRIFLIEPIPDLCNILQDKYRNINAHVEQCLITKQNKKYTLIIDEDSTARSSLYTTNPKLSKNIKKLKVNGMTLQKLLTRHNLKHIDILFIDAEGSDLYIITQLLKSSIRPEIIQFEHHYIRILHHRDIITQLKKDYHVVLIGKDTFCFKK